MRRHLLALALAAWLGACGTETEEENQPPLAGDCAHAVGILLGCDGSPIETTADACQKLLDCSAIPLASDGYFDHNDCLREIGDLPDERKELVFVCIEASSCDLLRGDLDVCLEG
jgi:hypothetical protein